MWRHHGRWWPKPFNLAWLIEVVEQVSGAELTNLTVAHLHQPEPVDLLFQELIGKRLIMAVEAGDDGDGL